MKQKKRILNKILFIVLLLAIIYNFLFLASTVFTRKGYLYIFGVSFLTINNDLVITRKR